MLWASITARICSLTLAFAVTPRLERDIKNGPTREDAHLLLELGQVGRAERIRLGNDGDEVDSGAESLHHLDVQRLESVARGADEVQAGVHSQVDLVLTAGLLLLQHVRLVLVVQELNDGHP